jgi:hypothetical protein
VVYPVTAEFDIGLVVAGECAASAFLNEDNEFLLMGGKYYFYYLGDFDPSRVAASKKIEEMLSRNNLHPDFRQIHFERIAVTPKQLREWNLLTRPIEMADGQAKGFGAESVELDAIDPRRLRALVREVIERHMSVEELATLKAEEQAERETIRRLVESAMMNA